MQNISNKLIPELIDDNYVNAYVLHFFGINFYNYSDKTLEQVCNEKGLNVETVVRRLESRKSALHEEDKIALNSYSIDLIVEYLKHTHYIFIKHKLPYISKLLSAIELENDKIISDLKLVFPFFLEDFIHHIYEEEDNLFSYILVLHNSVNKEMSTAALYTSMEKHSIREYALEHSGDDEMKGMRSLTNNYTVHDSSNLHLKVLYAELKSFGEQLMVHARVENEILFPKALMLEMEARTLLKSTSRQN